MLNVDRNLFHITIIEYTWIDCDYLLNIMNTTSNKCRRGLNDKGNETIYGNSTCPSLIDQENSSTGTIDQEQHMANEPELSVLNQCIADKSPSVTTDNKTVRQIKLKIKEASSTLQAKQYENIDSEEGDIKQSDRM